MQGRATFAARDTCRPAASPQRLARSAVGGVEGALRHASRAGARLRQELRPSRTCTGSAQRRSPGRGCRQRQRATAAASGDSAPPLPRNPVQMVEQAAEAVQNALDDGRLRQRVDLLLPVNEKASDFNNTETVDYPCSLQAEFDSACALTRSLLLRLLPAGTKLLSRRIDDGGVEGEPCAVIYPETKNFAAVVYPTAERLKDLKSLAKEEGRPLLIVNPQWREEGQVISDFGIGPWKAAALSFLAAFEPSYALRERRIGSPGTIDAATGTRFASGGVLRVLRAYPGQYQVHAMAADGSSQLLAARPTEPDYKEADALIKKGRQAKLEIFQVARLSTSVFASSDDSNDFASTFDVEGEAGEGAGPVGAGGGLPSDADIEALDAASLRRLLAALGQPTSGRADKLRQRLREARAGGGAA